MIKYEKSNSIIFGLSTSIDIAKKVSKITGINLGKYKLSRYRDREIFIESISSVRGKSIFVIQSTSNPANDNLMELLLFIDALKRSSAGEINIIIPYYGYARQDRKVFGRQPISAKLVANMLTISGASRIITFDIHSEQIVGFFDIPIDNLRAQGILAREIKLLKISKLTVVSPDHGGVSRARQFAKILNAPLAIIDKRRTAHNKVGSVFVLGDVKNRNIVIFDDMVDTGGTVLSTISELKKNGAKDIYLAVTHPVLSGEKNNKDSTINDLINSGLKKIITTNSINQKKCDIIKVVDLSQIIAETIQSHINNKSITEHFIKKYNTKL